MRASLARALTPVWATLNSLWVCRVSVLGVLAGWLLFYAAEQAQAAFFDLHTLGVGIRHWGVFYLAVFLFWMLPTQLSARVMLHAGKDRYDGGAPTWYGILITHLPWVLALACLASVAAGQYWAFEHIPDERDRAGRPFEQAALDQLTVLFRATIACIVVWVMAWIVLPPIINRLTARSGLLDIWLFRAIATVMFGRRATDRTYREGDSGDDPSKFSPQQLQTAWAAITLFFIWLASLYFVFLSPLEIRPELSRAPMLPIIVGAWLPVLTFLAYFAHRLRLPLLAITIVLMTILANSMGGLHDMRVLVAGEPGATVEARQPSLEETLRWWRKANGCAEELRSDCPVRPIIIAAEGGGSRAAFFTASLLAHLDDLTDPTVTGSPVFSRQLFAVSAVSGSTLGAAVYAALREEERRTGAWPRPQPEPADRALWFRSGKALGIGGVTPEPATSRTRKDVAQQILAGDFLTPVVAALSLDTLVPFHAKYYSPGDRTYFLEKSWEQRFADPSGTTRGKGKSSFERGFASLAPEEGTWRPHLIFNGTSVMTGRRIITSTLNPLLKSPDDPLDAPEERQRLESLFRDSYDTYDLMCRAPSQPAGGTCTCTQPSAKGELQTLRIRGCDVRLSTAVSNSARFPIISSHGDVTGIDRKPVDRIVDGGYFDYSGIVSALELRLQIARLDHKLDPLVVFVSNDPGFNPHACQAAEQSIDPVDELDVLRRPALPPPAHRAARARKIAPGPAGLHELRHHLGRRPLQEQQAGATDPDELVGVDADPGLPRSRDLRLAQSRLDRRRADPDVWTDRALQEVL
jgi:hypothetical protein